VLGGTAAVAAGDWPIDVHVWRIIPRESGSVDYYRVVEDPALPYIRADYKPGYDTAVLGIEVPSSSART